MIRPSLTSCLLILSFGWMACKKSGGGGGTNPDGKDSKDTTGSKTIASPINQPSPDSKGVWVLNEGKLFGGLEANVVRLDAASGTVAAKFEPPAPRSLITCGGDVWIGSFVDEGIFRIGATSNAVKAHVTQKADGSKLSSHTAMACLDKELWAINLGSSYELLAISMDDNSVSKSFPQFQPPSNLMVLDGVIHVPRLGNKIDIINSANGEVTSSISLIETDSEGAITSAYIPLGMTAQGNLLWVVGSGDEDQKFLLGIEKLSHKITIKIPLTDSAGGTSISLGERAILAADENAVWIGIKTSHELWRIDLSSKTVSDRIPVGQGPEGLAIGLGAIWVTNTVDGTVSKVDPTSRKVVGTYPTGTNPTRVMVLE